jgi:putative transposase
MEGEMTRAKRNYLPGLIWHITQRCHKREFLLKFGRDKRIWMEWMIAAKREFGLCVLSYTITSIHIHLLVRDWVEKAEESAIARSLHLAAGRLAQEYNARKGRSGAFWEDRYHATAVESGEHLVKCMSYIDMNMVRAGVVRHPGEWPYGAFRELQKPHVRFRNQLVDWEAAMEVLGMSNWSRLREAREEWVREELRRAEALARNPIWTESVAVGSDRFVNQVRERLGVRAKGRDVLSDSGDVFMLRDPVKPYLRIFGGENEDLGPRKGGIS